MTSVSERAIEVLEPGPLTTIQDLGRPGYASLGVGRSGACDRQAFRMANHLVGNTQNAAALEATFGGLTICAVGDLVLAITGAQPAGALPYRRAFILTSGQKLRLRAPTEGLRTYLAVHGGIAVQKVFGSRSTDLMSGIGPPALGAGQLLSVGDDVSAAEDVDPAGRPERTGRVNAANEPVLTRTQRSGPVTVCVMTGPRTDWFTAQAWASFTGQEFRVTPQSNRIAIRLDGRPLERARDGELHSEGMIRGAVEVPPSGRPMVFLADHPVTGGYPVIAYVVDDDVDACGQLRPGQAVRFRSVTDDGQTPITEAGSPAAGAADRRQ